MTILQDFVNTLPGQENVNPPASPGDILTYAFPSELLARLQREQGWDTGLTLRALNEYRRFIVLAMTAPHPVTPSKLVDEVWHTHVLFTRDYWDRLTPLLPRPLHHEPGDGSPGDDAHFAGQYEQTLDLYQQTFGQLAPADLWPDPRRGEAGKARAPRAAPQRPPRWLVGCLSLGLALPLTLILGALTRSPLVLLLIFALLCWLLFRAFAHATWGKSGGSGIGAEAAGSGPFVFGFPFDFSGGSADTCSPFDSGSSDSSCGDSGGSSCGSSCGGGGCGGGGCGS